jgi:two-component system CheB/CheR fusion protein
VTCRNLLIYLETELQERLIPLFHYVLNPDGYLFLGTSETLRGYSHLFHAIDKKWKLFRRTTDASQVRLSFGLSKTRAAHTTNLKKANNQAPQNLKQMIETLILEDFTRPCAIVDVRGEILYLHQRTDKYLEPAIGEATNNILRMAREGLRLPLTTALSRIHSDDGAISYRNLQVQKNGGYVLVNVLVSQLLHPPALSGYILIMFEDVIGSDRAELEAADGNMDEATTRRVLELEQELVSTKEYLQAVVEELEASNEELKSMNEELHASNEEMQSTNEELETASEELQSVNEELQTANSELENKIEELDESSRQLNDLLNNVDLGIIFLDRQLRIIRYTQFAKRVMSLITSDIGRPLSDLVFKLDGIDLAEHAQAVLNTLVSERLEVHTQGDIWHWITIKPYRTTNDAIIGVVITFIDVTELGRSRQRSQNIEDDAAQTSRGSERLLLLHSVSYAWQRFTMQQHTVADLIHEFCRLLTTIAAIQTALVYLPDSEKTTFASGVDADSAESLVASFIHNENRPEARAIASGEVVVAGDLAANPSFDSIRKLLTAQGYTSLVAVPLRADQRMIGLVIVYGSVQHLFTVQETQLLQLMADHLGSLVTLI